VELAADTVVSVTVTGGGAFDAPAKASVIVPVALPVVGTLESKTTPTVSVPDPVPDEGVTVSHGLFAVAVHVTVPAPLFEIRSNCAGDCEAKAVPVETAPKVRLGRSTLTVGGNAALPIPETAMVVSPPVWSAVTTICPPYVVSAVGANVTVTSRDAPAATVPLHAPLKPGG